MKKRIEDIIPGTSRAIKKGRRVQFTVPAGHRTLLYVAKGEILVNGETIPACHLIIFEEANEEIIIAATTASQILFLSPPPADSLVTTF